MGFNFDLDWLHLNLDSTKSEIILTEIFEIGSKNFAPERTSIGYYEKV